jgi:hypothetical protein
MMRESAFVTDPDFGNLRGGGDCHYGVENGEDRYDKSFHNFH